MKRARSLATLIVGISILLKSHSALAQARSKPAEFLEIQAIAQSVAGMDADFLIGDYLELKKGTRVIVKTLNKKTVGYFGIIESGSRLYGEWIKSNEALQTGYSYLIYVKMSDIEKFQKDAVARSSKPRRKSIRDYKRFGLNAGIGTAEPLVGLLSLRGFWNSLDWLQISWAFGITPSSEAGNFFSWSLSPKLLLPGANPSPFIGLSLAYSLYSPKDFTDNSLIASLFDTSDTSLERYSRFSIFPVIGFDWIFAGNFHLFATMSHTRFLSDDTQQGILWTFGVGGAFGEAPRMQSIQLQ